MIRCLCISSAGCEGGRRAVRKGARFRARGPSRMTSVSNRPPLRTYHTDTIDLRPHTNLSLEFGSVSCINLKLLLSFPHFPGFSCELWLNFCSGKFRGICDWMFSMGTSDSCWGRTGFYRYSKTFYSQPSYFYIFIYY